jgi:RNA recognition motif-containing protein
MDLCNLYIKGLATDMTSVDLFNLFKPFGRIISAKVMKANNEGLKNFGFVSFSHPIEAAKAMIELYNDQQFNIIVKFHEPKQHQRRSEQEFYQQLLLLRHSTLSRHFYTTSCYNNEKSPIPPIPPLPQAYQTPPQPQQVYAYYVPVITQPIIAANNNGTFVYQNHSTPTYHHYYYQPPTQPCGIISEQELSTHFTKTKFNRERHSSSKNK